MIRVAVLTVSDSAAAGLREDVSGPAVAERCRAHGWSVERTEVVADEPARISRFLVALAAEHDIVLTTGGTGVAPRDNTPEATRAVIEREVPGIPELMRSSGLFSNRRAALSRAVCGTRGSALILNLPGSPKGAVQSFDSVSDLLMHIVDLLQGRTGHDTPSETDGT